MKIIFMGTPDFAVGTLEAIIEAGHEVVLVVTQPDKPKGRSGALQFPPVKECAVAHGIEVFQPTKIRLEENVDYLRKYDADIFVVAAFGQILPQSILDMPKYGCINVHASLLPKYRGAAPIQWAVINGDPVTGVTIQQMDIGVDTGDIIVTKELAIAEDETGGGLFDKLAVIGAEACIEALTQIENGTATRTPQNHEEATHVSMISKEFGLIDWNKSCIEIRNQIRGLDPAPRAMTWLAGKRLKVGSAKIGQPRDGIAGTVISTTGCIRVQCGSGTTLELLSVQPEGKRMMPVSEYIKGNPIPEGTILGN